MKNNIISISEELDLINEKNRFEKFINKLKKQLLDKTIEIEAAINQQREVMEYLKEKTNNWTTEYLNRAAKSFEKGDKVRYTKAYCKDERHNMCGRYKDDTGVVLKVGTEYGNDRCSVDFYEGDGSNTEGVYTVYFRDIEFAIDEPEKPIPDFQRYDIVRRTKDYQEKYCTRLIETFLEAVSESFIKGCSEVTKKWYISNLRNGMENLNKVGIITNLKDAGERRGACSALFPGTLNISIMKSDLELISKATNESKFGLGGKVKMSEAHCQYIYGKSNDYPGLDSVGTITEVKEGNIFNVKFPTNWMDYNMKDLELF